MTDTGQVPAEGLPESAGMVEQPGVPAHGAYTYLSETTAEDEDLLLPGAQGAWGNEVPPPPPEPVLETVHQPGPHETDGRDSGSVDLGGVRPLDPGPVSVPPSPILSVPHDPAAAPAVPRRPLHLGPPIPDASASPVRSLADRGPAGAPVRQPGPATPGPEYLDAQPLRDLAPQGAVPWGAAQGAPGAQVSAPAPAAETVIPAPEPATEQVAPEPATSPADAAQAAVARLATQAAMAGATTEVAAAAVQAAAQEEQEAAAGVVAQTPVTAQDVPGHDPAYAVAEEHGGETAVAPEAEQGPESVPAPEGAQAPDGVPDSATPEAPETVLAPQADHEPQAAQDPEAVPGPEGAEASGEAAVEVQEAVHEEPAHAPATAQAPAETQIQEAQAQSPETEQAAGAGEPAEATEPAVQQTAEAREDADVAQTADGPGVPEDVQPLDGTEAPEAGQVQAAPSAEEAPQAPADIPEGEPATEPTAPTAPTEPTGPTEPAAVPVPEPVRAESVPAAAEAAPAEPTGADIPAQVQGPQLGHPQAGDQAQPATLVPEQPQAVQAAEQQPDRLPDAQPQEEPQAPEPGTPDAVTSAEGTAHAEDGAGPETAPAQPVADPAAPHAQAPEPVAEPVAPASGDPAAVPPGSVPAQAQPDQPLGRFVPVQGSVPTTPHLAPTPPHPLVVPQDGPAAPVEPVATVPAPREADSAPAHPAGAPDHEVVQHAEDLDTRAADQEESTAEVAEARQSTGPAAPGYDDAEREAVLRVMRERRDIRNGFRGDPIPHEVLLRVLEAAHTAPSVGHSQPWDFVVIRSAETRRSMHELAMRQRDAYAKSLPKGRAKQFKELKIEAILDTPVNIVVTADPTRGGRHTLGRHTQPQMAPYSAALAVENLWLAARAEGLGVGWVSFFDEREMVRALGLPEHLEVIAYLCVGYVDEFPDEPELMQAGWSKRRPLSWVVHEETYGRRALPGEDPHDLLAETVSQIRPLDAKALGEAWERQKRMTKPAGALGMLEIISAQLSGLSRQCPPPIPEPAAVAIFAGDHGVHAQGVTPWPQEVTAQMVANFLGGGAVCNAFAGQVGAEVCVVDVGVAADLPATPGLLPRKVRAGTSDMTTGPAMTREEAKQAVEVGIETARDLVAAGNKALLTGEMGIANTTASAALISVYTGADPAEVTGRGTGINDETLARKTEVVRRALDLHKPDPADPIGVLAAIGGFEHAAMVGLLLGGASLRTPVILDGVSAGAAALVARAIAPEVLAACIAGHRSAEPGHVAALNKLGLRPLVDLDLRLGEGTGALLALPLVQSTARAMHEVATFDSAGVTEK
ncbi:nicotinate-nucleotide--dimethylbenzimidazole phosphoribosyltransferase [Streptomyces sp. NPDC001480]|uniref:nicotinate-nucleotide--dimethylbenzimidazole phosphoribosyltransferase n=1 Tax=Streptomyces sp. NPDC001480 TaxID=3364577 RepID=UPI0036A7CD96